MHHDNASSPRKIKVAPKRIRLGGCIFIREFEISLTWAGMLTLKERKKHVEGSLRSFHLAKRDPFFFCFAPRACYFPILMINVWWLFAHSLRLLYIFFIPHSFEPFVWNCCTFLFQIAGGGFAIVSNTAAESNGLLKSYFCKLFFHLFRCIQ